MNAAVAEELGRLEARNRPEHPLLLRNAKPGLKSHQVPHLPRRIFSPQLHYRVRIPAGARIGQAHRFHWPEPERVSSPAGHLLDRQTALEVGNLVEVVRRELIALQQRIDESLVRLGVERGIQIIVTLGPFRSGRARTSRPCSSESPDTIGAMAS